MRSRFSAAIQGGGFIAALLILAVVIEGARR
jgi:hypothetical protein